MRSNVNKFTDEFKLMVVRDYLSSGISKEELKRKYNFGGNNNIYRWLSKFGVSKPNALSIESSRVMPKEKLKSTSEQILEQKIKQLEDELKREQFRTTALNTMIDIAERELKIDIRKKSGAKR